jgi:MFS transporter, YNFM family, putative membrane transport protein
VRVLPGLAAEGGDPGSRRMVGVVVAGFCCFLPVYCAQALLPELQGFFHTTELGASRTVGATTLGVALAAPLVGFLADAIGRKRVIVAALLGLTLPTLMAAHAGGLGALIAWRFVQGLFIPAVIAGVIAYITEESAGPRGGVGATMAAYVTGTVVGGMMGRFIAGLAAAHWGWRGAFTALGWVTLAGAIATWVLLPRSRRFVPQREFGPALRAFVGHLKNPRLLATYAVGFNVLFSLVGTFTYITYYLHGPPYGLSTGALAWVFLVYALGVVITPLAGRWLDRVGYRRTLALAIGAAACGVLLTLVPVLAVVVTGLAICASGVFVCQSAASSQVGVAAHGARSSAAGLYVALYYAGGTAGSQLPGLVWKLWGWPGCVGLIVLVQVATGAMAWVFWEEPGDEAGPALAGG